MLRYFVFTGGNGYCGCDYEIFESYPKDISEDEIEEVCYNHCLENAEGYEYMISGWGEDTPEEELEEYYERLSSNWKELTKEEYDNQDY